MRRERFKLADRAVFTRLSSLRNLDKFSCGNEHIDAFFKDEAVKYEENCLQNHMHSATWRTTMP